MASLKDIRQKIKGVTATQQITNAMRTMSTAKLKKAIESLNNSKVYISKLLSLAGSVKSRITNINHPALESREVKKVTTIVIGGERGLCGGFNQELHNFATKHINNIGLDNQQIYAIGQKPIRYFQFLNIKLEKEFPSLNMKELDSQLLELAKDLYEKFEKKETDRIDIIYTSYVSTVNHPIVCKQLLPIPEDSDLLATNENNESDSKSSKVFDFYPSPIQIFNHILPRYMYNSLLKSVLESMAAEQCSRMVAMNSATDRANEKLESLRLELNRNRQAKITQELNEVIAGSQT